MLAWCLWCVAAWLLWAARPWLPMAHAPVLVPLLLFTGYTIGTMLWFPPSVKGLQLLAVTIGFVGLILLTARTVELRPRMAAELYRVLDVGIAFCSILYLLSIPKHGLDNSEFVGARAYAIFALFAVARQVARWRNGETAGFWWAAAITAVIVLSVSRTAMAAAVLMFPLAALSRFDRRGVMQAVGMAVAGIGSLAAVVLVSPWMHARFFGMDASLNVGGVAINGSGRSEMWALLLRNTAGHEVFGRGVGSSSLLIDRYFPALGHPHNDYIRMLFDFGGVGLGLFLLFMLIVAVRLFGEVRRLSLIGNAGRARLPYFLTPLLGIFGAAAAMTTDNVMSYAFGLGPLAILIGCALGLTPQRRPVALISTTQPLRDAGRDQPRRPHRALLAASRVPASFSGAPADSPWRAGGAR